MATASGPKLYLRNPRTAAGRFTKKRYKAKAKRSGKPRRKSANGGMLTLMKLASANPKRRTKKRYTAKRRNRRTRRASNPLPAARTHRKRYTARKRRARRRSTNPVRAMARVSKKRYTRRGKRRSSNPFGSNWTGVLKSGGVALTNAVFTRAAPATIASLTGFANTGVVGYGLNIVSALVGAWIAEKTVGEGAAALTGGVVAIANRVVDDFTGVEVLNVNAFNQLTAAGASPAAAAAQATTVGAASPAGTAGLGRFDKKWSFVGSGYAGFRSSSFPPSTPYPGTQFRRSTAPAPAGASPVPIRPAMSGQGIQRRAMM